MRVVAEVGTCNGDLSYAISAAVRAFQVGADAFKVQLYHKDTLFTPSAPSYGKGINRAPTQAEDVGALLDYDAWPKVKSVCDDLGIEFFASAWDTDAVDALEAMNVKTYKVGSADITHQPLITYIASTGKKIILSTGAATLNEVKAAIGWIVGANKDVDLTLLACTLSYPTEQADANVSRMLALKATFPDFAVGYSDHTRGSDAAWVAASLGASVFEKHFTLTPGEGGDHDFAATQTVLAEIVRAARVAGELFGDPMVESSDTERTARSAARRSIVAAVDIAKGARLTADMVAYLRPGTGIPPFEVNKIIGREGKKAMRAMVDIAAGTVLDWSQVGYVGASLTVE